ncbi:cellulose synthase/poly-beta-1,6-N-acetylglucosamine synthase-like glycosyltransferase [Bradyrhizobium sp. USDA 4474]
MTRIMFELANSLLVLLALLILMQALLLFAQISASKFSAPEPISIANCPRIAVVVPAHDESAVIGRAIQSIRAQLPPAGRLLVVADNCTDDTARLAMRLGAEVIERRDTMRVGKGYALDCGVRFLARTDPPDVVVFVDADCVVSAGTLDSLARLSLASGNPVQASNVVLFPPSAGSLQRIAQFAWRVTTGLRPLGSRWLGLPCQLMGTGMAFPWSVISTVDLATGHLAEDKKLGVELALAGKAPIFCCDAQVTSWFPAGRNAEQRQRLRWELGHLAMIRDYVPRLLAHAVSRRSASLALFALDLSVPPLALFTLLLGAALCVGFAWLVATAHAMLFVIASLSAVLFGCGIALAWWRAARDIVSPRDLLAVPVYCALKVPTLVHFLTRRPLDWIRTERS